MSTITIEVPEELSGLVAQFGDRLPELLAEIAQNPALPAHTYRYVLNFLANNPSAEEIAAFGPTLEMSERLRTLVGREKAGEITAREKAELDEYEHLEHLMVMIKSGNLRYLANSR